jgi:hypothetical protein
MLSLPIEASSEEQEKPAHVKVMYIHEDKYTKYDFFLKAGKYSINSIFEQVLERVSKERKEVKSGRRTLVFADLRHSTQLVKFFTEQSITFNFVPGQELTTYAYEIDKKIKERLHRMNFVHLTKSDAAKNVSPFLLSPRIVSFSESDSIKSVCFKIFKEFRVTLKRALHSLTVALRG